MKRKLTLLFSCIFITYFNLSNVMAGEFDFKIAVNGSANDVVVSELDVVDNSFTFIFRGNTRDTASPGIGVFSGSTAMLDDNALNNLREQKRTGDLTVISRVSEPLKRLIEVGDKVAKLDATTNLELHDGQLLVDVAFTNSGRTPIVFTSPQKWGGRYNPIAQESWVFVSANRMDNSKHVDADGNFSTLWLGGSDLLNRQDFKEDTVRLNAGQTRHAMFLARPNNTFSKGRYELSSTISINYVSAPEALKGHVEFAGLDTIAVFDHDYPSKSDEIRAFRAHQSALK